MRQNSTFDPNVAEPTSDSSLYGKVTSIVDSAKHKFGATRAQVRSVRVDFNSLINRILGHVNKARKAAIPALAPITAYDVMKALANTSAEGLQLSIQRDMLFAFGRRIANTVGYDNHLAEDDIKDCISFLGVDYVTAEGNTYLTLDDLSSSDVHKADGELPAGATPVPAEMKASKKEAVPA